MNLTLDTILYYYEEPQIFSSVDAYGVHYLSLLVDDFKYLTIKVTASDFENFLKSEKDLRDLIVNSSFRGTIITDFSEHNFTLTNYESTIPESWLPDSGFKLSPMSQESLSVNARKNHACLVSMGIEAPESSQEKLQIRPSTLTDAINSFDKLFEAFYPATLNWSKQMLKELTAPRLLVYGFSRGSFKVDLKSDETLDLLLGSKSELVFTEIGEAIKIISTKDKEFITEQLKTKYDGRIVASLLKISDCIIKSNAPIYFEWASPKQYSQKIICDYSSAKFFVENFSKGIEVQTEIIYLEGHFLKVDTVSHSWTLQYVEKVKNKDKKIKLSGKVKKGEQKMLAGIVVESQRYKLQCEMIFKYDFSVGEVIEEYYLVSIPEIIK